MRSRAIVSPWPSLKSGGQTWSEKHYHSDRAECEWALGLIGNRGGGLGYFKCFKFRKTVTSLQRTAQKKIPSHTRSTTGKKRKMGPVCTAQRLAFSPARETKWKSMWCSAHIIVHVPPCFMFLVGACAWNLSVGGVFVQKKFCISSLMLLFIRCVRMHELCRIWFLHFPVLPLLLFSVMSPTVSLPTRPASLDLSHEEATFWLQWCVLKNPYLNSADPPPWGESSFWLRGCRLVEQHIFKYLKKGATSVMEHNCLQYHLNDQLLLQRVCSCVHKHY